MSSVATDLIRSYRRFERFPKVRKEWIIKLDTIQTQNQIEGNDKIPFVSAATT